TFLFAHGTLNLRSTAKSPGSNRCFRSWLFHRKKIWRANENSSRQKGERFRGGDYFCPAFGHGRLPRGQRYFAEHPQEGSRQYRKGPETIFGKTRYKSQ